MSERQQDIRSWSELSGTVKDLDPKTEKFAKSYFRAQLHIARGRKTKARRLFKLLDAVNGFREFEENNQDLLRQIDLAVKGNSSIPDSEEPNF